MHPTHNQDVHVILLVNLLHEQSIRRHRRGSLVRTRGDMSSSRNTDLDEVARKASNDEAAGMSTSKAEQMMCCHASAAAASPSPDQAQ